MFHNGYIYFLYFHIHFRKFLDLSYNQLNNIDQKAFTKLESLKFLDLSYNLLHDINLELPSFVEVFAVKANELVNWPLTKNPEKLEELKLQENKLTELFNNKINVENLKILNISGNQIESFPNILMNNLEVLDLSQNLLSTTPKNMSNLMPKLKTLIMDGNPIESIQFDESVNVEKLSFSYMPLLKSIFAKSFSNVKPKVIGQNKNDNCVDLTISHCSKLSRIEDDAFGDLSLCRVRTNFCLSIIILI